MSDVEVIVHPDAESLASSVAARLITAIIDAQVVHGDAGVVLTGGGMGGKSQQAVVANPAQRAVQWDQVDFYWGDERFVPADDPDRNEKQAYAAMLDAGISRTVVVEDLGVEVSVPVIDCRFAICLPAGMTGGPGFVDWEKLEMPEMPPMEEMPEAPAAE